jgi:hypothetical protein
VYVLERLWPAHILLMTSLSTMVWCQSYPIGLMALGTEEVGCGGAAEHYQYHSGI